ncbi:MAG: fused MFS/spermidine synthase [Candidatus Solibacter usitatus]|nr:fused MFS/spermidine synthase [Candidatus Solibacter usitatus]
MPFLCATVIFLGSLLLFLIQPLAASQLLPLFGGTAGVWTMAMLFFPLVLLLGYAYAHLLQRLPPSAQRVVHLAVAAISLAAWPIHLRSPWLDSIGGPPEVRILLLLAATVGAPYFVLSTTSPLLQAWYAGTGGAGLPYWLYGVSNAASLVGLLAYPIAIEPWSRKSSQAIGWSYCYLVFLVFLAAAAFATRRQVRPIAPNVGPVQILWIVLSAVPAALWLAVANQMSHSVAPVPLLWVLPLSIYLLTMILCFSTRFYQPRFFRLLFPLGVAAICAALYPHGWQTALLLFLSGLFVCAMVCHGELAARKPEEGSVTGFYLAVAVGGVLGSAFVSVFAPLVFREYLELPVAVVACVLIAVAMLYHRRSRRDVIRLAVVGLVALIAAVNIPEATRFRARNFYGILQVRESGAASDALRALYNGSVLHGSQLLDRERSRTATTYYVLQSGIGIELSRPSAAPRRIGVIGLGTGTIAAYGRSGDVIRFYEINPLVIQVARRQFRYLDESAATVEMVEGDARLELEREPPQRFDVLVLDAFSGDAVPVHLLTREAFHLYKRHLKDGGFLAAHVSSRYLKLAPLVIRLGASTGFESQVIMNSEDLLRQVAGATWVILKPSDKPAASLPGVWTDDYSNLLSVLQ